MFHRRPTTSWLVIMYMLVNERSNEIVTFGGLLTGQFGEACQAAEFIKLRAPPRDRHVASIVHSSQHFWQEPMSYSQNGSLPSRQASWGTK